MFSNVSFAYDQRKPAIENLSFTGKPRTSVAIIGESGSGKSICFKLLFRFYDVASGCIKFDNHDIRGLKLQDAKRHFGVVPPGTTLFNTSILYNIQYAKPDTILEEVYEECRAANIHDKILSFPEGYETMVGERDLRLSGGEKQRVCNSFIISTSCNHINVNQVTMARAILKTPQIILLDEAAASLDSHTEKKI
jgi:ABC-type transport system involved in Fe-S cluster assembly fused permease/ATPase subunit